LGFLGCIPWWCLGGFFGWWCCGGREVGVGPGPGLWKTADEHYCSRKQPLVVFGSNQTKRIRSFSLVLGVWKLQEITMIDLGSCEYTRRIKCSESRQVALILYFRTLHCSRRVKGGIRLGMQHGLGPTHTNHSWARRVLGRAGKNLGESRLLQRTIPAPISSDNCRTFLGYVDIPLFKHVG
jgi:hypothetical protein